MSSRARTRTLAGLVAAVALAGALVQPVAATYPGSREWKDRLRRRRRGNVDLYSTLPNGQARLRLTDHVGLRRLSRVVE